MQCMHLHCVCLCVDNTCMYMCTAQTCDSACLQELYLWTSCTRGVDSRHIIESRNHANAKQLLRVQLPAGLENIITFLGTWFANGLCKCILSPHLNIPAEAPLLSKLPATGSLGRLFFHLRLIAQTKFITTTTAKIV